MTATDSVPSTPPTPAAAQRLLGLLDLTLLDDQADGIAVEQLAERAASRFGAPAALCVWPRHIGIAKAALAARGLSALPIATVVNFPDGAAEPARVEREIAQSLTAGATEIDAVLPYRALRAGDIATCERMLALFRSGCGSAAQLKVILETGELTAAQIRLASRLAIDAGADFIKTSTGKVAVNATPAAATLMLQAIAERGGHCGFKAAGGIRTASAATEYLQLAERMLGPVWPTPARFRIGASALAGELHAVLAAGAPVR